MSQQKEQTKSDQNQDDYEEDVWKRAFDMFDRNRDGKICVNELGRIIRSCNFNPTEKEVKEAIKRLDKNGNGFCEFDEFKALLREMKPNQKDFEKQMMGAFKIFDQNRNQLIERGEVRRVLTNLGESLTEEELDMMMKYADLNGDNVIDYAEFIKLCMKPCF